MILKRKYLLWIHHNFYCGFTIYFLFIWSQVKSCSWLMNNLKKSWYLTDVSLSSNDPKCMIIDGDVIWYKIWYIIIVSWPSVFPLDYDILNWNPLKVTFPHLSSLLTQHAFHSLCCDAHTFYTYISLSLFILSLSRFILLSILHQEHLNL